MKSDKHKSVCIWMTTRDCFTADNKFLVYCFEYSSIFIVQYGKKIEFVIVYNIVSLLHRDTRFSFCSLLKSLIVRLS